MPTKHGTKTRGLANLHHKSVGMGITSMLLLKSVLLKTLILTRCVLLKGLFGMRLRFPVMNAEMRNRSMTQYKKSVEIAQKIRFSIN